MAGEKIITFSIADDHKIFRDGIKMSLSSKPFLSLQWEADDGEILLEQLKKSVPDILLLDIRMPQIDGIEALPLIKSMYPTVKIIVLSMYDDQFTIRKMMDLGANGYLTKTAEPEEIVLAIQACMNDELYINEVLVSSVLTQLRQKREYAGRYFLPVKFSKKEIAMLKLIAADKTTQEISELMYLSPRTVEKIRQRMKQKTGSKSVAGLVMYAMHQNIII